VGDPGARAGAHDRLQGGDEAARRALDLDPVAAPNVNVRLAVGDGQDFVAREVLPEDPPQRLGIPADLRLVPRPAIGRNSGAGDGACPVSTCPRIKAVVPAIQPRQETSAITTVMSATTAPMPAKR